MKKLLTAFILGIIAIPAYVFATPVSWDYANNTINVLQSLATKGVTVPFITSTSTATSTLSRLTSTNFAVTGKFYAGGSPGTNGYVLQTTGSTVAWVATSTLGLGGAGGGTVTSVDFAVPTGFTISGNPVTTSGTLTLGFDTGYTGVKTASTTEWARAYASTSALSVTDTSTIDFTYTGTTGAFTGSVIADSIGDTQLAFNTGQTLTTAGTPTFAGLTVTPLTSALLLTNGSGVLAEYAGTSCTNQFPRSLSALGAATCASVAIASDVSGLGSNVATFLGTPSSANLATALTDETGSGVAVFGTAPTMSSTTITGILKLSGQTASRALFTDAGSRATTTSLSATLLNSLTDETGTGVSVFNTLPTFTQFLSQGSSTIGGGTGATGLTVNGTATSTDLKVTNLTASRLIATAADKLFTSITNFTTWVTGTANEVTVADDGDGTVTVSLPATIDLGDKTSFEIPNGANPTVDAGGEIALNTTFNSLAVATGTTAVELPLYPPIKFAVASSSWTSTSTEVSYPTSPSFGEYIKSGICYANGTAKILVGNGVSSSTLVNLAAGTTTVAVEKAFAKNGTRIIFAIGTPSALTTVNCNFERYYTR